MPQTPHVERHFTGGETVRDVVIGMSDGLTRPSHWRRAFRERLARRTSSSSRVWPKLRQGRSPWASAAFCRQERRRAL